MQEVRALTKVMRFDLKMNHRAATLNIQQSSVSNVCHHNQRKIQYLKLNIGHFNLAHDLPVLYVLCGDS